MEFAFFTTGLFQAIPAPPLQPPSGPPPPLPPVPRFSPPMTLLDLPIELLERVLVHVADAMYTRLLVGPMQGIMGHFTPCRTRVGVRGGGAGRVHQLRGQSLSASGGGGSLGP